MWAFRLLKERQGASAMVRFERALMLAKVVTDKCQERRATRGLAAAARLQVWHCTMHLPQCSQICLILCLQAAQLFRECLRRRCATIGWLIGFYCHPGPASGSHPAFAEGAGD